jgi:uncharacterized membrane protein
MSQIRRFLIAYAAALACLLAVDAVWLSIAGPALYRPLLGPHLAAQPDFAAAGLFYLIYGVGLTVFAVRPGELGQSSSKALWLGALFGAVAYGAYDLTNQATLAGWPWQLSAIDMAWGAALSSLSATVGAAACRTVARLEARRPSGTKAL